MRSPIVFLCTVWIMNWRLWSRARLGVVIEGLMTGRRREDCMGVVWMQQIAVECIHVGGTEDGFLVAMAETHLKWESAVAQVGLVSVQHIPAVDVEHVCLVAYNEIHWEEEDSAADGSGNL